jgi:hypothetical protein
MSTGYTDREIMDKLNLQYRNYRKYKQVVKELISRGEEDAERALKESKEKR